MRENGCCPVAMFAITCVLNSAMALLLPRLLQLAGTIQAVAVTVGPVFEPTQGAGQLRELGLQR